jgi:hypothetical protein
MSFKFRNPPVAVWLIPLTYAAGALFVGFTGLLWTSCRLACKKVPVSRSPINDCYGCPIPPVGVKRD